MARFGRRSFRGKVWLPLPRWARCQCGAGWGVAGRSQAARAKARLMAEAANRRPASIKRMRRPRLARKVIARKKRASRAVTTRDTSGSSRINIQLQSFGTVSCCSPFAVNGTTWATSPIVPAYPGSTRLPSAARWPECHPMQQCSAL